MSMRNDPLATVIAKTIILVPLIGLFYLMTAEPALGLPLWSVLFVCTRYRQLNNAVMGYLKPISDGA